MIGAAPLAALLLAGSATAAQSAASAGVTPSLLPPCPESVQIDEKLSAPVVGWTVGRSSEPHRLAGITLFDGKPALGASLVGDDQAGHASSSVTTWALAKRKEYWLSCSYAGTNVTLTREIPSALRSCSAVYSNSVRIAGLPELTRFTCSAVR
jgi:hypothetical protein